MDVSVFPPIMGYALARRHQLMYRYRQLVVRLRQLLEGRRSSQSVNSLARRGAADSGKRAGLLIMRNTLLVDLSTRSPSSYQCVNNTPCTNLWLSLHSLTLLHANNGSAFENVSSVDVAFSFRLKNSTITMFSNFSDLHQNHAINYLLKSVLTNSCPEH
jgi:hypothetical protein